MINMFDFVSLSSKLPSVAKPIQRLNFKEKLKWTGIILILFFVLGSITVWGVNAEAVAQFEFLEIVFGSKFGSLISLGIGPIVTASIILQLLVGSKIIPWDTSTKEGKEKFMASQKLLTIGFCIFEAIAYVVAGAVPAAASWLVPFVITQLAIGGFIIMLMDEVCSKWGFGSGVSLFIAAGVSKTIFVRAFSPPLKEAGGGIIAAFISLLSQGQPLGAAVAILPLLSTLVVFAVVVFAQSMRIEIPMAISTAFGKFGARRWPLKFIYTSNIPVILTAAVIANLQVVGRLLSGRGWAWLGAYGKDGQLICEAGNAGLVCFLTHPSSMSIILVTVFAGILAFGFAFLASKVWKKYALRCSLIGAILGILVSSLIVTSYNLPAITLLDTARAITYMLVMIIGAVIFSIFWVSTSGMDAKSVAGQFKASSYFSIPGFRRDPRIIETILNRYIPPLAVLGGAFVGFLAAFADLTSALGTGTGILLTVMIVYQFYEQIAAQHMEDMHPAIRKFIGE